MPPRSAFQAGKPRQAIGNNKPTSENALLAQLGTDNTGRRRVRNTNPAPVERSDTAGKQKQSLEENGGLLSAAASEIRDHQRGAILNQGKNTAENKDDTGARLSDFLSEKCGSEAPILRNSLRVKEAGRGRDRTRTPMQPVGRSAEKGRSL